MTVLTRQQIIEGLRVHADRTSEDGWHTRAIYMHAAADELEKGTVGGNKRLKRSIEFDLADAPMLMAAVRLAACQAMMSQHKDADKRLRQYQEMFAQFVPPEAERFDEETWAEIGMALLAAKTYRVTIEPKRWDKDWWYEGDLVVYVDGRRFRADKGGINHYVKKGDAGPPQALHDALKELAPMECESTWDNAKETA